MGEHLNTLLFKLTIPALNLSIAMAACDGSDASCFCLWLAAPNFRRPANSKNSRLQGPSLKDGPRIEELSFHAETTVNAIHYVKMALQFAIEVTLTPTCLHRVHFDLYCRTKRQFRVPNKQHLDQVCFKHVLWKAIQISTHLLKTASPFSGLKTSRCDRKTASCRRMIRMSFSIAQTLAAATHRSSALHASLCCSAMKSEFAGTLWEVEANIKQRQTSMTSCTTRLTYIPCSLGALKQVVYRIRVPYEFMIDCKRETKHFINYGGS
jgi:hypothetical protein